MVLWPIRAHVLFELFYNESFLKKFFQHMETLNVFTYKPSYSKETQYNYIDNNENDRNSNSNN